MPSHSTIPAVIFDVDGTLLDSNDAHARAWVDALAEHGFHVELERVRRLIGMGGDKVLPELTGLQDESSEGDAITTRRKEIFRTRYLPGLAPVPGSRALVSFLKSRGHAVGVATSAHGEELDALLRAAQVADLIDHRASSSDADESKPDPDIIQAALKRLQVDASQAVMIGDTPYDLEAAQRASVRAIAFRSGGWDDEHLRGAAAIYDNPAELLDKYDGSALAEGSPTRNAERETRN